MHDKKKTKSSSGKINALRKEIQNIQLILIIVTTILLSGGGAAINITLTDRSINQNLKDTSLLITRLYSFTKDYTQEELCNYMDSIVKDLPDVDVISIVDTDKNRIYHTNHNLINTQYDGSLPDFKGHLAGDYIENGNGPSGPQRRIYTPIYNQDGIYQGFIMTIVLETSIRAVTINTLTLFLVILVIAIALEISICATISKRIKKEFMEFTEDFEGTKFLVDSMRANNHDFTNKLHVILGLIEIGEYERAVSYIENISIIQRETISKVMNSIDNPAFAALLVGKIARASECNVKFILQEALHFRNDDIDLPSEALVTITGNLIDNALDAMNSSSVQKQNELIFGAFTQPGQLLITVKDTGPGISDDIKDKVFENGFSTKGSGRGVGLFHTRQLIESFGGSISFESQEGKGCCFMVTLKKLGD
ncbi:MAG: Spo0B domain-containing protein [Treponemataceae bacterium]|nr:Spo0B domain-containing protein [Treponemataceae bacterium]